MPDTTSYGQLGTIDWVIVLIYLIAAVGLGISFARRGNKDMDAFFAGSGAIPWYIAGTSLLVACFAADTPLWIGDIIYKRGLQGAWFYWAPAIGTAFFILLIAPLWKRCGVLTDIQLLEVRYRGHAASTMRLLNSLFYGLFVSTMFLALQTLSIVKILQAVTAWPKLTCLIITMAVATSYSLVAGLWGVAMSGTLQFAVTYVGSVILALFALFKLSDGPADLVARVGELQSSWPQGAELSIAPWESSGASLGLPIMTLVALFGFRWIEQAGMGGYVAQRIIATKNPLSAVYTAMVWGVGFFAIVPLPWIITVVAAKVVLPEVQAGDQAYPRMAMLLPTGLKGILIASMLAAFMSTYSSLLSWGSSYVINDLYKRFLAPERSDKHYVRAGQIYMIPMVLAAGSLAMYSESLLNLIFVVLALMGGYWTIMAARWIWWRCNAWSEVAGLAGSIGFAVLSKFLPQTRQWWEPDQMEQFFGHRMIFISVATLVTWVAVTLLTRPEPNDVLDDFYDRVRPPGFWGPVRRRLQMEPEVGLGKILLCWIVMAAGIYGPLYGFLMLALNEVLIGTCGIGIGFLAIVWAIYLARSMYAASPVPAK